MFAIIISRAGHHRQPATDRNPSARTENTRPGNTRLRKHPPYELEPPPDGFAAWDDYWRDVGVPEDDLGTGADRIIDPNGRGPRIWFQAVPETKTIKNRLHLDICVSGGRAAPMATRKQRVDAEARRLADLGATIAGVLAVDGIDHYAVAMKDPEGNEFDIN